MKTLLNVTAGEEEKKNKLVKKEPVSFTIAPQENPVTMGTTQSHEKDEAHNLSVDRSTGSMFQLLDLHIPNVAVTLIGCVITLAIISAVLRAVYGLYQRYQRHARERGIDRTEKELNNNRTPTGARGEV